MTLLSSRIDLDAIAQNIRTIKQQVGPATRLMCVVKADAYGHGMQRVAPIMDRAGADTFGVATVDEAVKLRELGINKPIVAWIWEADEDLSEVLAHNIEVAVPSMEHAQALVDAEIPAKVTIKVDSGMHRSGVNEANWREVFVLLRDAAHITVTGLMSHLACADEPDDPYTDVQAESFRRAIELAREIGLECPVNHLANSAAALSRPDLAFDQVRVGLACYGLEPIRGRSHSLKPAMTWVGNLVTVKEISAGDAVSYGQTWRADSAGYIGIVACGYADGLPRAAQGKLAVGIAGKLYPQIGRVCMDQIVIDLGENPFGVSSGDEAVIFGTGGMSATELAEELGTINYEIVCLPHGRSERTFEGGVHFD